jgi:hypothetical protein
MDDATRTSITTALPFKSIVSHLHYLKPIAIAFCYASGEKFVATYRNTTQKCERTL